MDAETPDADMGYLRWAKTHRRARYELTGSGVPPARPTDLGETLPVSLEGEIAYGHPRLIEAIAELYKVDAEAIVPVPGTSSANFIAMAATMRHGECIMLERPVYQPLQRGARFLGLQTISLPRVADGGFDIGLAEFEAGLEHRPPAVMVTNLHNPSGCRLRSDCIAELADRCARVNATLIVDEVYLDAAHLTGDGPRWTAASLADNVVSTSSLTKVYGLGSLRAGWLIGSPSIVERAREIMDLLSVENAAPSTALALCALSNLKGLEERYRAFHSSGQEVFRHWLAGEPRVTKYPNCGALFECLRLPEGVDTDGFCDLLLNEFDTQVVNGRFFDLQDHIRISTALPAGDLTEALSRLSAALDMVICTSPS